MLKAFDFCFPTSSNTVPSSPDWLHEVKYDGYRLRLERNGNRVRLIARGGYNWTARYPWIVESALKNRQKHFVIDGEAVVLGVDGVPDFNALHSRKHDEEVQLYAFDVLALDGEDLRSLPLAMRKTNLARLLARRPESRNSNRERSGRTCFARRVSRRLGLKARGSTLPRRTVERLGEDQEPQSPSDGSGDGLVLTAHPAVNF